MIICKITMMARILNFQSYNTIRYVQKVQRIMDLSVDRLHLKLETLIDEAILKAFVSNHDEFNNTIFKEDPLELPKYSEVSLARINVTSRFLTIDAIVSFPILGEESLIPKFLVYQVGFMIIEDNNTTLCVKHVLPEHVMVYNERVYDIEGCGGSYPFGICRVDLDNLDGHLSCFGGESSRTCPQYQVMCSTSNYINLESGILFVTNSTAMRSTSTTEQRMMKIPSLNATATYISWNNTMAVLIGNNIHLAPDSCTGNISSCSNNLSSEVFDVHLQYQRDDVLMIDNLEEYGTKIWNKEEHATALMMAKQRHHFHSLADASKHKHGSSALMLKTGILRTFGVAGLAACLLFILRCCVRSKPVQYVRDKFCKCGSGDALA